MKPRFINDEQAPSRGRACGVVLDTFTPPTRGWSGVQVQAFMFAAIIIAGD